MTTTVRWLLLTTLVAPSYAQGVITYKEELRRHSEVQDAVYIIEHDLANNIQTPPFNEYREDLESLKATLEKYPRESTPFKPCISILMEAWKMVQDADGEFGKVPIEQFNADLARAKEVKKRGVECVAKVPQPTLKLGIDYSGRSPGTSVSDPLKGNIGNGGRPPYIKEVPKLDPSVIRPGPYGGRTYSDYGKRLPAMTGETIYQGTSLVVFTRSGHVVGQGFVGPVDFVSRPRVYSRAEGIISSASEFHITQMWDMRGHPVLIDGETISVPIFPR